MRDTTQLFAAAQCKALEDESELILSLADAVNEGNRSADGALKAAYESGFVAGGQVMQSILEDSHAG